MMTGPPVIVNLRNHLAARFVFWQAVRAVRTAHRQRIRLLRREMAGYATASDRRDFEATLDRHPDRDTQLLRRILADQPPAGE